MRYPVLALSLAIATAAVAGPSPVAPAASDTHLGRLTLTSLRDAQFNAPNDGKVFGVDAGPEAVAKFLAARKQPTDAIRLSVDGLLVRGIPGHVVLLDTGLGPKAGGVLPQSLARAGVSPAQVTDVLITHAHGDHVGGLLKADGTAAFPRATVRMSEAEWTWLKGQAENRALVDAIPSQVRTFAPGATVLPGITAVELAGHTPGHTGYRIVSGKASLLDVGDTVHSSVVSLGHPEWTIGFDGDAAVGKATREQSLAAWSKDGTLIFTPHFPYPGVGRITHGANGYAWQPAHK